MTFDWFQQLALDYNPSDVEFIEVPGMDGTKPDAQTTDHKKGSKSLLVVSNLGSVGRDAPARASITPINVYLYHRDAGKFVLYQSLELRQPDGGQIPPFSTHSAGLHK